jgi:hypothetical protein
MNPEDAPPTDEERREAGLLARALEQPARAGSDVAAVDDALGAAWLVRASQKLEQTELQRRRVLERVWPSRSWRFPGGAIAAIAAAAAFAFFLLRPRAHVPAPGVDLLRAQLAAARPGSDAAFARFEQEHAKYRGEVYAALRRAYGRWP